MYFVIGKGDRFTQKHIQIVYGHYVEVWDFRWLTIMHFVCRWTAMYLFRLVFRLLKEHDYWDTQLRRMKNIIAMLERTRCKIYVHFWMDKQYRSHLGLTQNSINSNIKEALRPLFSRLPSKCTNAGDGTWTHTLLPASDFESDASAIPPLLRLMNFLNKIAQARNILSYSKTDCKKIFCFWKIILHIF